MEILPELNGFKNVYQLYSILLKDPRKRDELQGYLLKSGIYTKVYFYPIHLKLFYRQTFGYKEGSLPISEEISKKTLTLPFSLNFKDQDQDFIMEKINSFYE